jgi:hypothetical protein
MDKIIHYANQIEIEIMMNEIIDIEKQHRAPSPFVAFILFLFEGFYAVNLKI